MDVRNSLLAIHSRKIIIISCAKSGRVERARPCGNSTTESTTFIHVRLTSRERKCADTIGTVPVP